MGACCSSDDGPSSKVQQVHPQSFQSSPEVPIFKKHRSCTDIFALIILVALLCGLAFFVIVSYKKGDIFRIINGYDDCANVCGRKTAKENDPKYCKGADMTSKPYLLTQYDATGRKSKECVANCTSNNDYIIFLNRCIPKKVSETTNEVVKKLGLPDFFREVTQDLTVVWRELIYLFLIALAISLVLLIAFRFLVSIIVYVVLSLTVLVSIAGSCYLWYLWYDEKQAIKRGEIHEDDSSIQSFLIYAITLTIVTFIIVLVVLVMRKRIALVIQLFREAGKAVASMPALLLQPIYTYLFVGLTCVAFAYFLLWTESAGDLYEKTRRNGRPHLIYKKDALLHIARWYTIFIFFVLSEFYLGCQHMVVAGAVARWFFTRDKRRLHLAVTKSAWNVVAYHLGTVALGSLFIGIIRLVRALLATVQKYLNKSDNAVFKAILCCCQCCLKCFENFIRFIGRNAYIETAIYGCSFCTGGKKAFQALSNNVLRVAAINSVGDFVLFLGKVLVVALTVLCGIFLIQKKSGVQHPWLPITVGGIFAFLIANCFISIYEMIIDTIFICFCEDCATNDGISRPYYMSKGLMEFVENSKKALRIADERQHADRPMQRFNAYPNPSHHNPNQAFKYA